MFFSILCFIISRTVKMKLKCKKKKIVVFRDVTNCVKSGLQSFMLEISCFVQQK